MKNFDPTKLKMFFVLFSLAMVGCASRQMIMQAPVVSVTKTHVPKGAKLKEGKEVKSTYCSDEKPRLTENKKVVGLVDEAIYKAQDFGQNDFLLNARIYRTAAGCYEVRGQVASLK